MYVCYCAGTYVCMLADSGKSKRGKNAAERFVLQETFLKLKIHGL